MLVINALSMTAFYLLYIYKPIQHLPLSGYFLYSGCLLIFIGLLAFFGGSMTPRFENEYNVENELRAYKIEEENMIRDMKSSSLYQNYKFTVFMILCSIPSFVVYLVLRNLE